MDAIGFDSLTSFLDRRGCLRAAVRLAEGSRRERRPLAVLWLDLDRFKQVNESFGHLGGDVVIARIASRLNVALSGRAEVSRMGGDEFVFLVPGCDREQAEEIAAELLRAVSEPIEIGSIRIRPSGSVGIAVLDDHEDPLSFIERADRAMVEAKRLGGGRHVVSGDEQVPGRVGVLLAREELAIESQIHAALESGGLTLHYQPIIGLDGRIEAAEALMRCHIGGESLPPGKIIPVAEKTGLIVRLGEWSMLNAAQHARRLRDAGFPIKLAVNVSRAQLTAPRFVEALYAAIYYADVAPEMLELELTESLFMDISDVVQSNLLAARKAGVALAIDDFGTGYSCLANLKDIPASKLKLDRAFVCVLPEDRRSLAVVRAMTQLGRELGMTVVAEGVETQEQHDVLCDVGVDATQGFLRARPMDADALLDWVRKHP
ncbi:MAG: EAL domain-containing protein [Gammaproteobacteria bacterium]|nr:EAL domain-containing protein [Gammaproteobacteria bacterium]MBU1416341.1 EAL domain-containing protein [Gammaproteobacteria bacterium]